MGETMKEEIIIILSQIRPEIDFTQSVDFMENEMLDSLDIIRLVSELDEKYGFSINGADIVPENFTDLEAICNLIKKTGGHA